MKTIIFMFGCLFAAACLQGQIIFIPNDFPSIQEGIHAANPGDTIIVSDGIYYERINFMGKKPLTVASKFLLDQEESHIANTILDGSQFQYANKSVVMFIMGEDTTSVLCGFTIRNGQGTVCHEKDVTIKTGGGIYINESGAKIIHNHITNNHLNFNPFGEIIDIYRGAGIATDQNESDHWVVLENNRIDQNTCISQNGEVSGAGVSVWCNARIENNTISHNICTGHKSCIAYGAGLICAARPEWENNLTCILKNNVIANNLVSADRKDASYAGVCLQYISGIIQENLILNNRV